MAEAAIPMSLELAARTGITRGTSHLMALLAVVVLILFSLSACAPAAPMRKEAPSSRQAVNVEQLGGVVQESARPDRARMQAAKLLAASSDPKALDSLFIVVRNDRERALLRAAMTRLLGRSPQKQPVAAFLVGRLADEKEAAEVRAAAAASLGALKASSDDILTLLRRSTADAAPSVRLAARDALVRIGGDGIDSVPLLIETVQDSAQPGIARASAAEQLGVLKDQRALPALVKAIQASNPGDAPARTLQEVFAARSAAKRNLPAAAARALGRLGDSKAISPLVDAIPTLQGEARVAAFEALAALKAREAVPAARKALSDPDQRVRRWAALLLREVGAKEALPELRQALRDEDPGVRLQAVLALERLNDRESAEQIREALSKETLKEVREAMEQALRTLTPQEQSPLGSQDRAT